MAILQKNDLLGSILNLFFTNNYLWWIATTSSEKIKIRKYPYMTEEELSETLYWEEDRLFGNTPIESSYRCLLYTSDAADE